MYINKVTYPINRIQYSKTNTQKPSKQTETTKPEGLITPAYSYIKPAISFKSKDDLRTYLREISGKSTEEVKTSVSTDFNPPKETSQGNKLYNQLSSSCFSAQRAFENIVEYNEAQQSSVYDEILLRIIKKRDFDVNKKYSSGYSVECNPLFILTTLNKPYLLQEALKKEGANPNIRSGYDDFLTPLMRAAQTNSLDCAYVLLKSGKVTASEVQRCLKSCPQSNKEMTGLLNSYPNVDTYINNLNKFDTTSLVPAIKTLSDVLKNPKANVNFVDSNGNNIFHVISCIDDENDALQLLFNATNRNANINRKNKQGLTPTEIYMKDKKYKLVCAAIDKGADLSVFKDEYKNTFAHKASLVPDEYYAMQMLSCAHRNGLSLDEKNFVGITPVISATKAKKYQMLLYLINIGVSINSPDNNGMTPLHYACMLNDKASVNILLNNFVNAKIKDKFGKIATDYLKDPDLIKLCKKYQTML